MKIELITIVDKRKPADLLIAGCFEGEKSFKSLASLEPEFAKSAELAVKNKRFSGKKGESLTSFGSRYKEASEILMVGLGSRAKFELSSLRPAFARLVQFARSRKVKNIRLVGGDHDIDCKIPGIGAMGLKSEFVKKVTE